MSERFKFQNLSSLKFLNKYAKRYQKNFLFFYIGCLFDYILYIIIPIISGIMIDQIVYHNNLQLFLKLSVLQVTFVLFYCYIYFFTYNQHSYLSAHFTYDLKIDVFRHLMNCTSEYLTNTCFGEIIAIIDEYSNDALKYYIKNIIHNINNILNVIFCLIYIYIINIKIGIVVSLLVVFSMIFSLAFGKKLKNLGQKELVNNTAFKGKTLEVLSQLRQIKLLNGQNKFLKYLSDLNKKSIKIKQETDLVKFKGNSSIELVNLIFQLILFFVLAYFSVSNSLRIGSIMVVLAYYSDIKLCFNAIINSYFESKTRLESIRILLDFIEIPEENSVSNNKFYIFNGDIEYNDVSLNIEEKKILKNISLKINAGSKVGIIGKSGSGKTTMVYMLLRFFEPTSGNILIDGQTINDKNIFDIRKQVGIVLQDNVVLNMSIRDNIVLANKNVDDESVLNACSNAGLTELLFELPCGLDTIIGSKGIDLSSGQKQRICIARMYIQNPKIVILDEPTSMVDNNIEKELVNCWNKVLENRTVLLISHRLFPIINCDKVVMIDEGRIINHNFLGNILNNSNDFYKNFPEELK